MHDLEWTARAKGEFERLESRAQTKKKNSKQAGLFRQLVKTLKLLRDHPRHPGLCTHQFWNFEHPTSSNGNVFESYVQNRTPGAYRIFWCYGPGRQDITLIAITPHP